VALAPNAAEVQVAQGWILYGDNKYDAAASCARAALDRKADCDGAYVLLGRSLFAAKRYQEVVTMSDAAIRTAGNDYNTYVPIMNSMGALGKTDALRNLTTQRIQVLEAHLGSVPEDARARTIIAGDYATMGRMEEATREANLAIALRPNDAIVAYNIACTFCKMENKDEALKAIRRAWEAGYRDPVWSRNDPDLAMLHGDADFDRMYPPS
jgi:tetratricopeptide (TPR) repeat protein